MYIGKCKICKRIFVSSYISHFEKKHNLTRTDVRNRHEEIVEKLFTEESSGNTIQGIV